MAFLFTFLTRLVLIVIGRAGGRVYKMLVSYVYIWLSTPHQRSIYIYRIEYANLRNRIEFLIAHRGQYWQMYAICLHCVRCDILESRLPESYILEPNSIVYGNYTA